VSADDLTAVLLAGNSAGTSDIDMNTNDILQAGTVNAQTLSVVSGLNSITATTSTNHIVITDGTTTNTIDKLGYTTRNSVQNSTHYLDFSASPNTGTGPIQKTSGLECNPSTKTITATTFVGALTGTATTATNATNVAITDDNTNATFYPVFVSDNTGNLPLKVDKTTNPLSYNPSTGVLTTTTVASPASTALTLNGTNGTINLQSNGTTAVKIINGVLSFNATANGILNRETAITLSLATTTVLDGDGLTFRNFDAYYTGGSITITTFTLTSIPANCDYSIAVQNAGAGTITFQNSVSFRFQGGTNFLVPTGRIATVRLQRLFLNGVLNQFFLGTLY
jgi:hypothetical protein